MQVTCPCCHTRFPIAAGFADDDGKRLSAQLADMEPAVGRATIAYLRLWKPIKQQLRAARAVKIVRDLKVLVDADSVCRDERGGARRRATPMLWAEGMEQMLAEADKLTLPITGHNYLRAIVFGLADKADATRERQRETDKRAGRHLDTPTTTRTNLPTNPGHMTQRQMLHDRIARIEADRNLGLIEAEDAEQKIKAAREAFGAGNG